MDATKSLLITFSLWRYSGGPLKAAGHKYQGKEVYYDGFPHPRDIEGNYILDSLLAQNRPETH